MKRVADASFQQALFECFEKGNTENQKEIFELIMKIGKGPEFIHFGLTESRHLNKHEFIKCALKVSDSDIKRVADASFQQALLALSEKDHSEEDQRNISECLNKIGLDPAGETHPKRQWIQ